MNTPRSFLGLCVVLILAMISPDGQAGDFDLEATASGGSTGNLFSDSTNKNDTYSRSSVDFNWYPRSFARVNLAGEYTYYGNFFNLSNLVYGGGLTIIPMPDSSRLSTYFEANLKKREYRDSGVDSISFNANEFAGNEYDGMIGAGYRLNSRTQLRSGLSFASSQFKIDGVIDRERLDITAGANTTLFGSYSIDLDMGYSTGKYQSINPITYVGGDPSMPAPRRAIVPGEQYSVLLTKRLRSFYISPRVSSSLGKKTGLALTYSHRQFLDRDEDAIIYGYSTGYLSPWLGEYAGQAFVVKIKTYLIPRLITSISVGFWEREHIRTVEREQKTNIFGVYQTVNLLYAQDRTDWRRRVDFKVQWPLNLGSSVTLEPSIQADYTDDNSTVLVYDYDDFAVNGGVTVRF